MMASQRMSRFPQPKRDTRPTARPTGLTRRGTWPKLFSAFGLVLAKSLQLATLLMRKLLHTVRWFHFNDALQRIYMYHILVSTLPLI